MTALTLPRTLTDPGTGVATAVQERRILWPLLALMAATVLRRGRVRPPLGPRPGHPPEAGDVRAAQGDARGRADRADHHRRPAQAGHRHRQRRLRHPPGGARASPSSSRWSPGFWGRRPRSLHCSARPPWGCSPSRLQRALWGVVALWQLGITEERARHLLPSSLGRLGPRGARSSRGCSIRSTSSSSPPRSSSASGSPRPRACGAAPGCGWGCVLFLAYVGVFGVGVPGLTGRRGRATGPAGPGGPGGGG